MRFDDVWGDDEAGAAVEPLVPDGTHSAEIVEAKERKFKFFQDDKNREGRALVVVLAVPRHQAIETLTPIHYRGKIEAICRAARVPAPSKGGDWDERQLVGRMVTIDTLLAVSKSGKEYVRIESWHAGPEPVAPTSRPPARTAAAKVEAAGQKGSDDDIPF